MSERLSDERLKQLEDPSGPVWIVSLSESRSMARELREARSAIETGKVEFATVNRMLDEARHEIEKVKLAEKILAAQAWILAAELATLREDKARLDWCDEWVVSVEHAGNDLDVCRVRGWQQGFPTRRGEGANIREAIDAARKGGQA